MALLSFHHISIAHFLNNKRHNLQRDGGEHGHNDFTDDLAGRDL